MEKIYKVKAYSKKELASMYKRSVRTLNKWIDIIDLETNNKKILTPKQVRTFSTVMGCLNQIINSCKRLL